MRLLKHKDTKEWFPIMTHTFEEGGKKLGEENIFKDYNFDFGETYTLNYKFKNSKQVHTTLKVSGHELLGRSLNCLNQYFTDEEDINNIRNFCCEFFCLKSIREMSKSQFEKVKKDYVPWKVEYVDQEEGTNSGGQIGAGFDGITSEISVKF